MISAHSANPCRQHNLVAKQVLSIFASLYAKARHQLDDYQNKQALRIVRETQAIGLETLNVHGMSRIHGRSPRHSRPRAAAVMTGTRIFAGRLIPVANQASRYPATNRFQFPLEGG